MAPGPEGRSSFAHDGVPAGGEPGSWLSPSREELGAPGPEVARTLLGLILVRRDAGGLRAGRIVETEGYAGPEDLASHARAGRTRRTSVMFGPAGHAYVYLVYGMHHCLNVVCGPNGRAGAVLVRALEPLLGLERMRARRGPAAGPDARLAAGPARLCQALDIDRRLAGVDLLGDERLRLLTADALPGVAAPPAWTVVAGRRIGVDYAGEWAARRWRFGLAGHPSLSRPFPGQG